MNLPDYILQAILRGDLIVQQVKFTPPFLVGPPLAIPGNRDGLVAIQAFQTGVTYQTEPIGVNLLAGSISAQVTIYNGTCIPLAMGEVDAINASSGVAAPILINLYYLPLPKNLKLES